MAVDPALLAEAGKIFRVLSNQHRLAILYFLENNAADVSTIVAALNLPQPQVSHQLAILHQYQLVTKEKDGQHVIYTLDDPHILEIVDATLAHVTHEITGAPHPYPFSHQANKED